VVLNERLSIFTVNIVFKQTFVKFSCEFDRYPSSLYNQSAHILDIKKSCVMLKREDPKKSPVPAAPASPPLKASVLGPSLVLEGEISGSQHLEVQGRVRGKITLPDHDLTINREGEVHADIQARNIVVHGSLEGTIQAGGTVTIPPEGRMSGDIAAARISIGEGAFFKGRIKVKPGR
jgi:cytoskeletal protein CcmA (bactofilin family)